MQLSKLVPALIDLAERKRFCTRFPEGKDTECEEREEHVGMGALYRTWCGVGQGVDVTVAKGTRVGHFWIPVSVHWNDGGKGQGSHNGCVYRGVGWGYWMGLGA